MVQHSSDHGASDGNLLVAYGNEVMKKRTDTTFGILNRYHRD